MNAHINLDLGIVAADIADRYGLAAVEPDFHQINALLAGMIGDCKAAVGTVSPWVGLLDRWSRRENTVMVRFSLERAREAAWHTAERLAPMSPEDRRAALVQLDADVHRLSRIVAPGHMLLRVGTWIVRLRERRSIPDIIDVLSNASRSSTPAPGRAPG